MKACLFKIILNWCNIFKVSTLGGVLLTLLGASAVILRCEALKDLRDLALDLRMLWLLDSLMCDKLWADESYFFFRILGAILAFLLVKILGRYCFGGFPIDKS